MKRFVFIGLCLFFIFHSLAFPQADGTSDMTIYTEISDSARRVSFKALDFFEPERYRPDYSKFSNNGFFDNMFIGIYGGVDGVFKRERSALNAGTRYGISITKFFNPYSGLKLSASMARNKRSFDKKAFDSYNISLDYEFNVSSYVDGFKPDKFLQVISSQGIGTDFSYLNGEREISFDLHWGLKFRFNVMSRLNFYMEPRLLLYGDNYDFSKRNNWRRYDLGYGALFGLEYALGNKYHMYDWEKEYAGWKGMFIAFSGGIQAPLSDITDELGIKRVIGPSLAFTVGKWVLPSFGAKASLFASGNTYERSVGPYFLKQAAYGGLRLEAMFNIMGFSELSREWRFSVEPSAGLESGVGFKQVHEYRRKGYVGATAGVQLKYRLNDGLAFYVEPRYSFAPFHYEKTDAGSNVKSKEHIIALNFGVEAMNFGKDRKAMKTDDFVPHFTFSTGIGGAMVVQQLHYINRAISHMANIGIGYWFNSISGLRLDGNLGTLITRMPENLSQVNVSSSLNYTLNIVNLMEGYNSERKWNAEVFLGPLLGFVNEPVKPLKLNFGIQGGGRLSYRLSENFDFYAEPRFHIYTRRLFPVNTGSPAIANLNFGGTYHFAYQGGNKKDSAYGNGFLDNTFVGFTMGGLNSWENIMSDVPASKFWNATGAEYSVYVGKWLTPFIGLKASIYGNFYSYSLMKNEKDFDRIVAYGGAGLELLFNPFKLADREKNHFFEVVPMAGIRASELFQQQKQGGISRGEVTAFTVATQFRFNVYKNMSLNLEPRWTRSPHNNDFPAQHGSRIREDLLSLSIGVEMTHSMDKNHKSVSAQRDGYDRYLFASVSGGLNSQLSSRRYGRIKVGYGLELYGGYSLTPLSAFRIGYDYCQLPKLGNVGSKPYFHSNNIVVDYLFDISNFVLGYNSDRRVGLQIFAGPVCALQGKNDNMVVRLGAEAGAIGYVRVFDKLYFNLQPKARAFMETKSNKGTSARELLFDFTAGLTYRF